MADLYAKPSDFIETGYNPEQQQAGGVNKEVEEYLNSLPLEERDAARQRLMAPPTGEEIAMMVDQDESYVPTIDQFGEIEKWHKTKEVGIFDGLGTAAEMVFNEFGAAFGSATDKPLETAQKLPATVIEAFMQGTRSMYGMAAQSQNPDSPFFRVKDFLNGTGTIEDRYNQYIEALDFNRKSKRLMEGKETLVMDKDLINPEVTQAMSYIADPTLFIPFAKVASAGARAVGMGEKLTLAAGRATAIKNKIIGGAIKWGAGQPLEFLGGAVRNTIDFGLEKAGDVFETATGMEAKEFARTARLSGIGVSAAGVAGHSIPYANAISDAYFTAGAGRGLGEALTAIGETMGKSPFDRGINSWAREALEQANKSGTPLSKQAQGLLKVIDAVDPMFAYSYAMAEGAAQGMAIGGTLGYLSGGEEGLYQGMGAGLALGTMGAGAGKVVADVTGGTGVARRAVQAKMVIEGKKVTDPETASTLQAIQKAAEIRGNDVDLVNGIIASIDKIAPDTVLHGLSPEDFVIEAVRQGYNPKTGKFAETVNLVDLSEFGDNRQMRGRTTAFLRLLGGSFAGDADKLLRLSKDERFQTKLNERIKTQFNTLSEFEKDFVVRELKRQKALIDSGKKKASDFRADYEAVAWGESWTAEIIKKFNNDREGAKRDIKSILDDETVNGKLTKRGQVLKDRLRAEGFLSKNGDILSERNLHNADMTALDFISNKGAVLSRKADGKTHLYLNLERFGDETFPHELFHAIFRDSPMRHHFVDSLAGRVLGVRDTNGNLVKEPEVPAGEIRKFIKQYIDATTYDQNGVFDRKTAKEKYDAVEAGLKEYEQTGDVKKISEQTRDLVENYVEEFGAYYFSQWIMGKNRNYLFYGGQLKGIAGIVDSVKENWLDFWQSKISSTNPSFDFSNGINEAFKRGGSFGRVSAIDFWMRDMVRANANSLRGAFNPDTMSAENARQFYRSNGIRNLADPDGRAYNANKQKAESRRLGREAFKILKGLDPNLRTTKTVLDADGKEVITGRFSEAELDALVRGGIVPRAWADKVKQGYAMVDGTMPNVASFGYLGKTEQIGDYSWPRKTGKDVAFKNRKAIVFDVETKVRADGTFYTLFHTLDKAVIEQRASHLWQDVNYRNLWDGDRGAMEADFFLYLSNASKSSTDPTKVDSATLLNKGDGLGVERRNVLHQMAGMSLLQGDSYKYKPIAEIPEGIRQSVTTFNVDGMTTLRIDKTERYNVDMNNAHKFIRENWQPDDMKQEKTPNGVAMTHASGFKFLKSDDGKVSAYTSYGRKIGTYNSIRDAVNAGRKEYNNVYKGHPLDIAKSLNESEKRIARYEPLSPEERQQAIEIGDVFELPSVKAFVEGLPLLRQTREEFILDRAGQYVNGDPEVLWKLGQEKAKVYDDIFNEKERLKSEQDSLEKQRNEILNDRREQELALVDTKQINFYRTLPYESFFPDYVVNRINKGLLKDNQALKEILKKYGIDYARYSDAYGKLFVPEKTNDSYFQLRKRLYDALNSKEFSDWYEPTTYELTRSIKGGDLGSLEKRILELQNKRHKLDVDTKKFEGLERLSELVSNVKSIKRPEVLGVGTEAERFRDYIYRKLNSDSRRKWSGLLEELFADDYDAHIQTGKPIVLVGTHGTRSSSVMLSRVLLDEKLGTRFSNAGSAYMGHFFAASQDTSSSYADSLHIKPNFFAGEFINEFSRAIDEYAKQQVIVVGDQKYERMVSLLDDLRDANIRIGNGVYEWGKDAFKDASDAFIKDIAEARQKLENIDENTPKKEVHILKQSIYKSYQRRVKGLVDTLLSFGDASQDLVPSFHKTTIPDIFGSFLDGNNTKKQTIDYLNKIVEFVEDSNQTMNERTFKNMFLDRYADLGVYDIKIDAKGILDKSSPSISFDSEQQKRSADWASARTRLSNPFYKLIDSSVIKDSSSYIDEAFNQFMEKVYKIDDEFKFGILDDLRLLKQSEVGRLLPAGKQIRSLIKLRNPKVVLDPRSYEEYHLKPHMDKAKAEGHDGIIFQKLDDGAQVGDTIVVVFKGNQENIKTIDTTANKQAVPRGKHKDINGNLVDVRYGKDLGLKFQPDEVDAGQPKGRVNIPIDKAYALFKREYEESTGTSWSFDKFQSRARNWDFYGDENGFIAVRPQRSGFVKLVGMAGDNKSKLRAFQQLAEQGMPLWGMVSKEIKDIAVKRGMREPNLIERTALRQFIKPETLGDAEIVNYTKDGGVILRYPDVGEVTKYMIGTPEYYAKLRSMGVDAVKDKLGIKFQPDEIPKEKGTTEIKAGYTRVYHQTTPDNIESIMRKGLLVSKSRPTSESRGVSVSETPFYGDNPNLVTIELQVPTEKLRQANGSALFEDVPASNIIAVHENWHDRARYILNNPETLKEVLNGDMDFMTGDGSPEAKAIEYIKKKYSKEQPKFQPDDYRGGDDYWKPRTNPFERKDEQGFLIREPYIRKPARTASGEKVEMNPDNVIWEDIGHFKRLSKKETGLTDKELYKWENNDVGLWAFNINTDAVVTKNKINPREVGFRYTHGEWFDEPFWSNNYSSIWGRYEKPIYDKSGNLVRRGRVSMTGQYRGSIKDMAHAKRIKNDIAKKLKVSAEDIDAYIFDASEPIKQSMGFSSRDQLPIKFQPDDYEGGVVPDIDFDELIRIEKEKQSGTYKGKQYTPEEMTFSFIGRYASERPEFTKGLDLMYSGSGTTRSLVLSDSKTGDRIGAIAFYVQPNAVNKHAFIQMSDVKEKHQGKGYGTLLYSELAERLRSEGYTSLDGRIVDELGRPLKIRQNVIDKENKRLGERGTSFSGERVSSPLFPDAKYQPDEGGRTYSEKEMAGKFIGRYAAENKGIDNGLKLFYGKVPAGMGALGLTLRDKKGEVVAHGQWQRIGDYVMDLDVKVDPKHQGKGYGNLLYSEAVERMRADGVEIVQGFVIDEKQRPVKIRQRIIDKENARIGSKKRTEMVERIDDEGGIWESGLDKKAWYEPVDKIGTRSSNVELLLNGMREGRILRTSSYRDLGLEDSLLIAHTPDTAKIGQVTAGDKALVDLQGGIFYAVANGKKIWASNFAGEGETNSLVQYANRQLESNPNRKTYIMLVKADNDKIFNSVDGARGVSNIFKHLNDSGVMSDAKYVKALRTAAKNYLRIEGLDGLGKEELYAKIDDYLLRSKNVGISFEDRADFTRNIATQLKKSGAFSSEKSKKALINSFHSGFERGFSKVEMEMVFGNLMAEDIIKNVPRGHIYGAIEIVSPLKETKESNHRGYDASIEQTSGEPARLIIFDKTAHSTEVLNKKSGDDIHKYKKGEGSYHSYTGGNIPYQEVRGKKQMPFQPAEWSDFKTEQSPMGKIIKNAKGYSIMLINNKYRVYNPAKAIIGVYGNEEEAKRRVLRDAPKQ